MVRPGKKLNDLALRKARTRNFVIDLRIKKKQRLISRRKDSRVIEIDFDNAWLLKFLRRKKRKIFAIGVPIFVLVIFFALLSFNSKADIVKTDLYASSCLGSWQNPTQAEGVPDVKDGGVYFTKDNSAYAGDNNLEIYCGGFKGDTPPEAVPKKFTLKLSWLVTANAVTDNTPSTSPLPAQAGQPSPYQGEGENTTPPASVPENSTPIENSVSAPEIAPIPDTTPTPDTAPAPVDTPVSFLWHKIVSIVYAQDVAVSENTTQVVTMPADDLLEVLYTLDGTNWKSLGRVNAENWQNSSFEINDPAISKWEDLSKLQISVHTLPATGTPPVVYLDSAYLEVEYENITPLPEEELAKINLKDNANIDIITGDTDFSNGDEPTFVVTDPNLSKDAIDQLIQEDKAEVISDPKGKFNGNPDKTIDMPQLPSLPSVTLPEGKDSGAGETKQNDNPSNTTDTLQSISNGIKDTLKQIISPVLDTITPSPPAPLPSTGEGSITTPSDTPPPQGGEDIIPAPVSFFRNLFSPARALALGASRVSDVTVLNNLGEVTDIGVTISTVTVDGVDHQQIKIEKPPRNFRPGNYTLRVTLDTLEASIISEQNFSWGVLTINTDRSIYRASDDAYIQMGVLNNFGHTLCNANLALTITGPTGTIYNLNTNNNSIVREPECGADNFILIPDYYTHFTIPNNTGTYQILLTAQTENGSHTIHDSFNVVPKASFDVRRVAPTRINPIYLYPVTLYVTPDENFKGIITETVPADFTITVPENSVPYDNVETVGDPSNPSGQEKIISWNIDLAKGESITLGYHFDAPDVSPEMFLLGPLKFYDGEGTIISDIIPFFEEAREWQIASDATCTLTTAGTWDGTAGVNNSTGTYGTSRWTGCAGGVGFTPAVGDTVQIGASQTLQLTNNGTIGALLFTGGVTGQIVTVDTTKQLTVSGAITSNSAAAAATTATITGAGTVTAASIQVGSTVTPSGTTKVNNLILSVASLQSAGAVTLTSYRSSSIYNNPQIDLQSGTLQATTVTMTSGNSSTSLKFLMNSGAQTGYLKLTTTTPWTVPSNGTTTLVGTGTTVEYSATGAVPVRVTSYFNLILSGATGTYTGAVTSVTGTLTMSNAVIWTADAITSTIAAVTLNNTSQLTTAANMTISGALTINNTATFTAGASFTLSVTGATSVTGTITFPNTAALKTFTGGLTINSGGSYANAGNSTLSFGANGITNNKGSGISMGTGLATFTATGNSITGNSDISFGGAVTINTGQTITNINTGTVTIATTLTLTGNLTQGSATPNPTLSFTQQNPFSGAGTFNAGTNANTVVYTASAATVKVVNYQNLTLSGGGTATGAVTSITGTLTLSGATVWSQDAISSTIAAVTLSNTSQLTTGANMTISGNLTINNTASFTTGANFTLSVGGTTTSTGTLALSNTGTKSFTGLVTISAGTMTTGTGAITFKGGLDNDSGGTVTISAATTFNTASQNVSGTNSITFSSTVTISGGWTVTNLDAGTVTITGALDADNASSKWLQGASSTLSLGGTTTFNTNGILDASTNANTVNYTGSGQTVENVTYRTLNIVASGTDTLGGAVVVSTALGISSGTLELSSYGLEVDGTTSISGSGTLDDNNVTGTNLFVGGVTINTTGSWTTSNNPAFEFRGGLTITAATAFTSGAGIYSFTTNGQAIGAGIAFSISNVTVTGVTLTNNNTNGFTIGTALAGTGGLTQGSGAVLKIGGISSISTLTATVSTNTVHYIGTGGQAIFATTYDSLTINGTGAAMTIGGATVVNATMTVSSIITNNNTLTVTTAFTGASTLTQGNGATLNIGGTSTTFTLDASTNANTVNYTGGAQTVKAINYSTLGLSGSGAKTMTSVTTIGTDFNMSGSATATPVITTIGGNLNISGTAVMTTGAIDVVSGNLSIGAGSKLTMGNFALTINGTSTINGTIDTATGNTGNRTFKGLVNVSNGAWSLSGQNPAVFFEGGLDVDATSTFASGSGVYTFQTNAQSLSGTQGSVTITSLTNNISTGNGLSVEDSDISITTLTQGTNAILTFAGTVPAITTLTATANPNTVQYSGATQTIKATTYHHLTVNGSGTATLGGTTVANGTVTATGGILDTGNNTLTASTIVINGGIFTAGSSTINLSAVSGTLFTKSSGTFNSNTSEVKLTGTSGTPTIASGTPSFYKLTINGASGAPALAETLTATNALTVTAGTLTTANNTINAGTLTVNGGIFTAGSATVNLTGTSGTLYTFSSGTITSNTAPINLTGNGDATVATGTPVMYTLTSSGTGTKSLGEALTVSGALTVSAGTFDTANNTVSAGNMVISGGTFPGPSGGGGSFGYKKSITIDHTKVPNTDQTDFPVLVSFTSNDLRTTGNGGHVTNANGYDIEFFSASDLSGTKLSHEIESYDATTGKIEMWVKVPTVATASDTVIYMGYGNSGITTSQEDKAGTWNTNYKGVWHMEDASGAIVDSTGNYNFTSFGSYAYAQTGDVGKAGKYARATTDYIKSTASGLITPLHSGAHTISLIFTPTSNFSATGTLSDSLTMARLYGASSTDDIWIFLNAVTGKLEYQIYNNSVWKVAATTETSWTAGTWYWVDAVFDPVNGMKLYLNGTLDGSDANTARGSVSSDRFQLGAGMSSGSPWGTFNGKIDEVSVSNSVRLADWSKTKYNNQNSPGTFLTVGTEIVTGSGNSSSVITLTGTGTVFNYTSGTYTAGTSTIKITDASATAKTFAGGGQTYGNIWITGAGTGDYTISGSNTFADFKIDTPPHTVMFTAGTTTTISTWTVSGTAGNIITLKSTSDGNYWELSDTTGTNTSSYLSLRDSHVIGGATWEAGGASTNVSGNTGWSFFVPNYSITISANGTISYGFLSASGSKDTTASGLNTTPVVTNDGNTSENLNIKGYNTACPWTLAGSIGTDQYKHEFSTDGGSNWNNLTTNYQTLATGVSASDTKNIDLKITIPSSTACLSQQSPNVTIQAVAP